MFTVNVPPSKSGRVSFLVRARVARSRTARAIPVMESSSAFLITGTTSPSSPREIAIPRLIARTLRMP